MTDQTEAVARAIAASDGYEWDALSTIQRQEYVDKARAAIARAKGSDT